MTGTTSAAEWAAAGGIGIGTWVVWAALAKLAIDGPPERLPRFDPQPTPATHSLAPEPLDVPDPLAAPPAMPVHDQTLQLHEVKAYRARHAKGQTTCL